MTTVMHGDYYSFIPETELEFGYFEDFLYQNNKET